MGGREGGQFLSRHWSAETVPASTVIQKVQRSTNSVEAQLRPHCSLRPGSKDAGSL